MPLELQPDQFQTEIANARVPVLMDFWGPQCAPCIALHPTVEALETRYNGGIKVVKVNAPDHRKLCIQMKVLGLPTFILVSNGNEVARLSKSTLGGDELTNWVAGIVPVPAATNG